VQKEEKKKKKEKKKKRKKSFRQSMKKSTNWNNLKGLVEDQGDQIRL
jgi:hypothetical protein